MKKYKQLCANQQKPCEMFPFGVLMLGSNPSNDLNDLDLHSRCHNQFPSQHYKTQEG